MKNAERTYEKAYEHLFLVDCCGDATMMMVPKEEVNAATTISFEAVSFDDCTTGSPVRKSASQRIKCTGYWVKQNGRWKLYCTKTRKKIGNNLAYKQYVKNMYVLIGGVWYYMSHDGYMYANGPVVINNEFGLFFNTSGKLVKNAWGSIHETKKKSVPVRYRTNAQGELITGWKQISGKWYYF